MEALKLVVPRILIGAARASCCKPEVYVRWKEWYDTLTSSPTALLQTQAFRAEAICEIHQLDQETAEALKGPTVSPLQGKRQRVLVLGSFCAAGVSDD